MFVNIIIIVVVFVPSLLLFIHQTPQVFDIYVTVGVQQFIFEAQRDITMKSIQHLLQSLICVNPSFHKPLRFFMYISKEVKVRIAGRAAAIGQQQMTIFRFHHNARTLIQLGKY
uniref:Secreted protein n=1 Tax=Glossina brevipalpis TaxID=37001 RepID=A0A1A9WNN9_9MUSC